MDFDEAIKSIRDKKQSQNRPLMQDIQNDFDYYSSIGMSVVNPTYEEAVSGKKVFNPATFGLNIKDSSKKFSDANKGNMQLLRSQAYFDDKYNDYSYMSADEIKAYNYYLGRELAGNETGLVDSYMKSIANNITERKAKETFDSLESTGDKLLYGINAGLSQFGTGVKRAINLITGGDESVYNPTEEEYVSSMVRNDLSDNSKALGVVYDIETNVANMLPSIVLSVLGGPLGVSAIGAASVGVDAAGNSAAEMKQKGYSDGQAALYGAFNGVSEVLLGELLSKFGGLKSGKLTGKILNKFLGEQGTKITNGITRAFYVNAVKLGSRMAAESVEEGLQEALEPVYEWIINNPISDGNNISQYVDDNYLENIGYAAALGGITAGLLNTVTSGVSAVNDLNQNRRVAETIKDRDFTAYTNEYLNRFDAKTIAGQWAGKVDQNTSVTDLVKIISDANAQISLETKEQIQAALVGEGFVPANAEFLTDYIVDRILYGGEFTQEEADVVNANDILRDSLIKVLATDSMTENQIIEMEAEKAEPANENVAEQTTADEVATEEAKPQKTEDSEGVIEEAAPAETVSENDIVKDFSNVVAENNVKKSDGPKEIDINGLVRNLQNASTVSSMTGEEQSVKMSDNVADTTTKKTGEKTNWKKGVVKSQGVTIDQLKKRFNDTQDEAYKILSRIAEVTGIDVVLFESTPDAEGYYVGENGKFRYTSDTIFIDINAGLWDNASAQDLGNYTMLRTFSHEITHFIQKHDAENYEKLKKVVFDTLSENGEDVEQLIEDKMEEYNCEKEKAENELVAESMTDMLRDSEFVNILAKRHRNIFEYLLDKLKEFVARIKSHFSKLSENTIPEATALQKEVNGSLRYIFDIIEKFDVAAVGAVENYQKSLGFEYEAQSLDHDAVKSKIEEAIGPFTFNSHLNRFEHVVNKKLTFAFSFGHSQAGYNRFDAIEGDEVILVSVDYSNGGGLGYATPFADRVIETFKSELKKVEAAKPKTENTKSEAKTEKVEKKPVTNIDLNIPILEYRDSLKYVDWKSDDVITKTDKDYLFKTIDAVVSGNSIYLRFRGNPKKKAAFFEIVNYKNYTANDIINDVIKRSGGKTAYPFGRHFENIIREIYKEEGLSQGFVEPTLKPVTPAKVTEETTEAVKEETKSTPSETAANNIVKFYFDANRELKNTDLYKICDKAFGGTQAEGKYDRKDAYDAMELAVNKYLLKEVKKWNGWKYSAQEILRNINAFLTKLPTETVRTEEQIKFQQFSTPPNIAFVATWAANINAKDHVLEPSAGIGGLALFAKANGATVTVNELSKRRLEVLRSMGFDNIFNENAEHIDNILPDNIKPTVVVMNPPFSATAGRLETNKTSYSEAHINQALLRLADNGRLVTILGRGMSNDKYYKYWDKVRENYNVRANISVDGKNYAKYGTTFDVQIVVIDKTGPQGDNKTLVGNVSDLSDAIKLLEGIRNDRNSEVKSGTDSKDNSAVLEEAGSEQTVSSPVGIENVKGDTGIQTGHVADGGGTVQSHNIHKDKGRKGDAQSVQTTDDAVIGHSHSGRTSETSEEDENGKQGIRGRSDSVGDVRGKSGRDMGGRSAGSETQSSPSGLKANRTDDGVFADYVVPELTVDNSLKHPAKLVESSAMAAIDMPKATYIPSLPDNVLKNLSGAQRVTVVYAGQSHKQMLPNGERKGFFIGDGTGVGKGREISGIIYDNFVQGRKKAVWLSDKSSLIKDAIRDWTSTTGRSKNDIKDFRRVKLGSKIPFEEGILFGSYDTLKSSRKEARRIDQIIEWLGKDFDGVIAFDEAHNLGNLLSKKGSRGTTQGSQKAKAGNELQSALPNAKIVYVSATAATEVGGLAFASRLGLWGKGTAFADVKDFVSSIGSSGLSAMELVVRDMKAMGVYSARSISYEDVKYDTLTHDLDPIQTEIYNTMSKSWQIIMQNVDRALKSTSAEHNGDKRSAAKSQLFGALQRFYNQILVSMSMPTVIEDIGKELNDGHSCVLQIVNTNQAAADRNAEKARASNSEEDFLEEMDLTPRETIIGYLENSFPVEMYEDYIDDNGNLTSRPVIDSAGNPVLDKSAVRMRDELIQRINEMSVPDGPLEMLYNVFGTEKIAEVTGRTRRFVPKRMPDGTTRIVEEKRTALSGEADTEAFQDGKKRILIFSNAGGTGRSYHADLNAKNQQQRIHYVLQPGWEATKAVQGFGRTHRSNEASAPIYKLVTTNIKGQKRFTSTIARRLDQLGALTKGQRDTGSGMFGAKDNLETDIAKDSLRNFYENLGKNIVEGVNGKDILRKLGLDKKFTDQYGAFKLDDATSRDINTFLNRILVLEFDEQNLVFDAFTSIYETALDKAIQSGTIDTGMENIKADKIEIIDDKVVREQEGSSVSTHYIQAKVYTKPKIVTTIDEVENARSGFEGIFKTKDGDYKAVYRISDTTTLRGSIVKRYKVNGPNYKKFSVWQENTLKENAERVPRKEWQNVWDEEVKKVPEYNEEIKHMLTGALLPIWNQLPSESTTKVQRLVADDGKMYLGRVFTDEEIDVILKQFSLNRTREVYTAKKVIHAAINNGTVFQLSYYKAKIFRSRVSGEWRLEYDQLTNRWGVSRQYPDMIAEKINFVERYFIPLNAKGEALLDKILEDNPVLRTSNDDIQYQLRRRASAQTEKILTGIDADTSESRQTGNNISPAELTMLNAQLANGEVTEVFRTMQLVDGKLYPPMSAQVLGAWRNPAEFHTWTKSLEETDFDKAVAEGRMRLKRDKDGESYYEYLLEKGSVEGVEDTSDVWALYAPYFHTSPNPLNDQLTSTYKRTNLVTVRGYVPNSEIYSPYKDVDSKRSTGYTDWHKGTVSSRLPGGRKLILSRYFYLLEIVDDNDVAQLIKKQLSGLDIAIPVNVVTPSLRRALIKAGIKITDSSGLKNAFKYSPAEFGDEDLYQLRRIPKKDLPEILMGSLFSGGGTLEDGLDYKLLKHEFGNEIVAKIASVYKANYGDIVTVDDIRNFSTKDKRNVFYLHASTPCDNFSRANHFAGEKQSDIDLARSVARILDEQKPKVFTLENVSGYKGSASYSIIIDKLRELGYNFDADTYSAADFGSPTMRKRLVVRAVKDGELPKVPAAKPHVSWAEATRDIWDSALVESTLAPYFKRAIANTPELSNLDLTKLDKPLMIYSTNQRATADYAWGTELAPTITSKCGDARLIINGKVYRGTPEFWGRLQGLSKGFIDNLVKSSKMTKAYEIIGNGIPTQFTHAIMGGLLESAYYDEYEAEFYQLRTRHLSDRELLEMVVDDFDESKYTEAEKFALNTFRKKLGEVRDLETERVELGRTYKEQQFGKNVDREAAAETLARMRIFDEKIRRANAELLSIEDKKVLKDILHAARKSVEKSERLDAKDKLSAFRNSVNEKLSARKYREKVDEDVAELRKWLVQPDLKKHLQYVPDILKEEVGNLLLSINYSSKRSLNGGPATQNDLKVAEELKRIKGVIAVLRETYGEYTVDIPEDFNERLDDIVESINNRIEDENGYYILNKMSAEELKALSELLADIKHLIKAYNITHENGVYSHVDEAGKSTMSELEDVRISTGDISYQFDFALVRPAFVFERFGPAGYAMYKEFVKAQGKLAKTASKIIDDAGKIYTEAEVKEWTKSYISTVIDGETVYMTVPHAMSLRELYMQEDSKRHLLDEYAGGMRVSAFNGENGKKVTDTGHIVTDEIIKDIIGQLTPRQIEVADKLQQYMAVNGGRLGNEIFMIRYGRAVLGENTRYFPINSDGRHLVDEFKEHPDNASMYALLNMSWTKDRNPNANNRIIIYDIFDVFANHMSSMAQYNAFAMPVLDIIRWLNYKDIKIQYQLDENGKRVYEHGKPVILREIKGTVKDSLATAFGSPTGEKRGSGKTPYAVEFVENLIKAYNGTESNGIEGEGVLIAAVQHYNVAQIAFNLRVVAQQPLAITRAGMYLPYSTITKAFSVKKQEIRSSIDEMHKYSGLAVWKDLGYYDINVSRGLSKQIKHDKSFLETVNETGLKAAEVADTVTWAWLWRACKIEVSARREFAGKPYDESFYEAVTDLFEEIIVKSQVVDSIVTKPEFLRNKGLGHRVLGAFMSEPLASYSMVESTAYNFKNDAKKNGFSYAWTKHDKMIARTIEVYIVSAVVLALVQSIFDTARDDDTDQSYTDKYLEALTQNLGDELSLANKIPIVTELREMIKELLRVTFGVDTYGTKPETLLIQAWDSIVKGAEIISDKVNGKQTGYTWYSGISKELGAIASTVGFPLGSITREIVTFWNTTAGNVSKNLKVQNYITNDEKHDIMINALESGNLDDLDNLRRYYKTPESFNAQVKSAIGDYYISGRITEEQANRYMTLYFGNDVSENYWQIDRWNYSRQNGNQYGYEKYEELYTAVESGKALKSVIKRYKDNGVSNSTLASQITSEFKERYVKASKSERAKMKGYLLNAYEQLGYDRKSKSKEIDKWLDK